MLDYRVYLDRTADPVRAAWWETRVLMEEGGLWVRRVHLDNLEQQDYQACRDLLVLKVPGESEANLDPEAALVFQDNREDRDHLEIPEQPDAAVGTDQRDNQENRVNEESLDHWEAEECRVRMVEMVMDPQALKAQREILVFLVILVCRARTACRDPKGTRGVKGTAAGGETRAGQESRESWESQEIQDTRVPEVLLEAWG